MGGWGSISHSLLEGANHAALDLADPDFNCILDAMHAQVSYGMHGDVLSTDAVQRTLLDPLLVSDLGLT